MKLNKSDWAYFAGLFDGEGYVGVRQVTRKTDTKSCKAGQVLTTMQLSISNNNPVPLLELKRRFGGSVRKHSPSRPNSLVWYATGFKAVEFAEGILPFTRIKTGQLEIYIAFAALKRTKAMGPTKLTSTEISTRVAMIHSLEEVRAADGGKIALRLRSSIG